MINGDHVRPARTHRDLRGPEPHALDRRTLDPRSLDGHGHEPHCAECHDRGWIDDMSTAVNYLRRCPGCAEARQPVAAAR